MECDSPYMLLVAPVTEERKIPMTGEQEALFGIDKLNVPRSDIPAIKDCILRLSQLVSDHPEIDELDINPLIVYPEGAGCVLADARILLSTPPARTSMIEDL